MLVYQATKHEFLGDVLSGDIAKRIEDAFLQRVHKPSKSEVNSWQNSMQYMHMVLSTDEIPSDCGVAIEFGVPYTNSRIDFLLSGRNDGDRDAAVIVELKQWSSVESVLGKDGVVRTHFQHGSAEVPHPSYQAWSYSWMLEAYNESVRDHDVDLAPCAYLHNYIEPDGYDPLRDPAYLEYLKLAPAFCQRDAKMLQDFICRHITRGDGGEILYQIEAGKLRPSKSLQDALASMLKGNREFVMIDDQKTVYERAMFLARKAQSTGEKHVLIVRGGPGTGKSVVAVNMLVNLTRDGMVVKYVTKNSAPRHVYSHLLRKGDRTKAFVDNLFVGPGKFYLHDGDPFDALVVDEAHRLNEKSGLYLNLGENQIKELINAARFCIFFIDEEQRVTIKDIGRASDIKAFAKAAGAQIHETQLTSQFRCNGSDGYLSWLDDVLGIRPSAEPVTDLDYDFRVYDNPNDMHARIEALNSGANKARVVAGYCWDWDNKKRSNPAHHDVVIPEQGYARSWNLNSSSTWAIDEGSVDQVGCIHTCQGLEFDYVGVIIGDDLHFKDGRVMTDHTRRAKTDAALKGIKKLAQQDPERAARIADELIRNTYRVLMTRGMKGCFVYCTNQDLADYLRSRIPTREYTTATNPVPIAAEDPLED
jgi:DUF2075 family protein